MIGFIKYYWQYIYILGYILFIFLLCLHFFDPDFGWHIRMGQIILAKGIPYQDVFSYTMPSYRYVDHEWLTDVGFAIAYPFFGMNLLSIIFVSLGFLALFLQIPLSIKRWSTIPLLLAIASLVTYMGIRPQTISWVCFSFLIFVLRSKNSYHWKLLLAPLFLIWANIHGAFGIGIFTLGIYTVSSSLECKKIIWTNWFLFFICLLITLINPYGYRMWGEVGATITSSSLHTGISEWLPAFFSINYGLILFIPLSLVFLFYERKHFALWELTIYLATLLLGISSSKYIPFWIIIALPLLIASLQMFANQVMKNAWGRDVFSKTYAISFICIALILLYPIYTSISLLRTSSISAYPQNAVAYLHRHLPKGQIFTLYDFGGFMIWQLPEKKVFVDGRMPDWQQRRIPGESENAFKEYNYVVAGRILFSQEVKKYSIDTVVVPSYWIHVKKQKTNIVENYIDNLVDQPIINPYSFLQQVRKAGFHIVYRDDSSVIYHRP